MTTQTIGKKRIFTPMIVCRVWLSRTVEQLLYSLFLYMHTPCVYLLNKKCTKDVTMHTIYYKGTNTIATVVFDDGSIAHCYIVSMICETSRIHKKWRNR